MAFGSNTEDDAQNQSWWTLKTEALAVLMQFLGNDGTRCVAMDPLKA